MTSTQVERFLDWVDHDAPDWVSGALAGVLAVLGVIAMLVAFGVLAAVFVHAGPIAGWLTLAAMVWFGPVRFVRWAWRQSQADPK